MAATPYFTPDLFRFLSELKAHNERDWFQKNKDRYERSVRDPFLRFIADLGPRLKKISPQFVADPSPVGGSMMRIYRDTRFSKTRRHTRLRSRRTSRTPRERRVPPPPSTFGFSPATARWAREYGVWRQAH